MWHSQLHRDLGRIFNIPDMSYWLTHPGHRVLRPLHHALYYDLLSTPVVSRAFHLGP